jgi:hypothetical protein
MGDIVLFEISEVLLGSNSSIEWDDRVGKLSGAKSTRLIFWKNSTLLEESVDTSASRLGGSDPCFSHKSDDPDDGLYWRLWI